MSEWHYQAYGDMPPSRDAVHGPTLLRDGDVILDIGGREPQTPQHAMRILASFEPGEAIPIAVMRQRRRETVTIAVPDEPRAWFVEPRPSAAPRPEVAPRAPAAPSREL